MAQAPAAIFKIPTESPQLARGPASRARKAADGKAEACQPGCRRRDPCRHPGRRGSHRVGPRDHRVPAPGQGGRWRAAWYEDGERQQCESVSEEKLAAKLEKVRQRLAMGAANMAPWWASLPTAVSRRRRPPWSGLSPQSSASWFLVIWPCARTYCWITALAGAVRSRVRGHSRRARPARGSPPPTSASSESCPRLGAGPSLIRPCA